MNIYDFLLEYDLYGGINELGFDNTSTIDFEIVVNRVRSYISSDASAEIHYSGDYDHLFVLVDNSKIDKLKEVDYKHSLLLVGRHMINVIDHGNELDELKNRKNEIMAEMKSRHIGHMPHYFKGKDVKIDNILNMPVNDFEF